MDEEQLKKISLFALKQTNNFEESVKDHNITVPLIKFLIFNKVNIFFCKTYLVLSVFIFFRELLFLKILLNVVGDKFKYYLVRSIRSSGDEYRPMVMGLLGDVCRNNEKKWIEVFEVAKVSLKLRSLLRCMYISSG